MSGDHEAEFDLVMPFIVTASHGGPYDDEAYVAGWEAAEFSTLLDGFDVNAGVTITPHRYYRTANVPQLDLIAMKAGWQLVTREWGDDAEWSNVSMVPLGQEDPLGAPDDSS